MQYSNYVLNELKYLQSISNNADFETIKNIIEKMFCKYADDLGVGRLELVFYHNNSFDISKIIIDSEMFNRDDCIIIPENPLDNSFAFRIYPVNQYTSTQALAVLSLGEKIRNVLIDVKKNESVNRNLVDIPYVNNLQSVSNLIEHIELLQNNNAADKYSLVYFDIRGFKNISEACGSSSNVDIILNEFLEKICKFFKEEQILFRSGVDTFYLVIDNKFVKEFATYIEHIEISSVIDGIKIDFSFNNIITTLNLNFNDSAISQINKLCDAVKLAKRDNAIGYVNFDSYKDIVDIRNLIHNDFYKALDEHRILCYYQPKVDPYTNKLVGSEVLCRWQLPDGSIVNPGLFIPILEENGLIFDLDEYILRMACENINSCIDMGIDPVPVSVNYSRYHFINGDNDINQNFEFIDNIKQIINEYGFDTNLIQIEITEAGQLTNHKLFSNVINKFHENGITVLMDDYGSAYSSLILLRNIEFDVAKIDRALIKDINGKNSKISDREIIILKNQIKMLHELNIKVICEGVEDEKQIDFLKSINCDYIQGYYYDKPLPESLYLMRLKNKKYGD